MSFRTVQGLNWARVCDRPGNLPVSRPRGAKAAGVRYERELARALPAAKHGQWWEFQDRAGVGHCQTDLILEQPWGVLVLEAKYTWTEVGHGQIERLYKPVLSKALGVPVFGLVVCKVLTPGVPKASLCRDLAEAADSAWRGRQTVLHWIGGSLGPLRPAPLPSHLATLSSTL